MQRSAGGDETVLPKLTAEDLKELGVGVLGHRRKLLDAITALRAETNKRQRPKLLRQSIGPRRTSRSVAILSRLLRHRRDLHFGRSCGVAPARSNKAPVPLNGKTSLPSDSLPI